MNFSDPNVYGPLLFVSIILVPMIWMVAVQPALVAIFRRGWRGEYVVKQIVHGDGSTEYLAVRRKANGAADYAWSGDTFITLDDAIAHCQKGYQKRRDERVVRRRDVSGGLQ